MTPQEFVETIQQLRVGTAFLEVRDFVRARQKAVRDLVHSLSDEDLKAVLGHSITGLSPFMTRTVYETLQQETNSRSTTVPLSFWARLENDWL